MRRITLFGAVLFVLAGGPCWAFGPGAHAYVAERIVGTGWPVALFGAMAPDLSALGSTQEIHDRMAGLTHNEFERLTPSPFALGFATHNNEWGADRYIHCHHTPGYEPTYFTCILEEISSEFGLTMLQSEDVVDSVIDYVLRRDLGPEFGELIALSAGAYTAREEQQLVDAYAGRLAQSVGGLSLEQAEDEIRAMGRGFQTVSRVYGEQLALWTIDDIRTLLVQGLATGYGLDTSQAEALFARTESLCWDCQSELDLVAAAIEPELVSLSTDYRLPLGPEWLAVLAVVLGGWACRRVAREA